MKKSVLIIVILIFIQNSFSQENFNSGVKVPTKEQLSKVPLLRVKPKGITQTPKKWDLSSNLPTPKNQGNQGSCAAWSLGYGLKSYHERIEENDQSIEHSPSYIYNQVLGSDEYCLKINNDDCGDGMYINCGLKFLKESGSAQLEDFSYSGDEDDCYELPSYDLIEDSKKYRILSFDKIHDSFNYFEEIDLDQFKEYIASGIPVIVGMYLDLEFWEDRYGDRSRSNQPFVWDKYRGDCRKCYHAMLCVGYDDQLNAFKFMNSYGVEFGNEGYGWIDYQVAQKAIKEAYITRDADNEQSYFFDEKKLRAGNKTNDNVEAITNYRYDNWLKKGYYRDLDNGIRISVTYLNRRRKEAIFHFYDTNSDSIIELGTYFLKKDESYTFDYKNTTYEFTLRKIGAAGKNIFKSAAFYSISIQQL